jgi:cytochrome P450
MLYDLIGAGYFPFAMQYGKEWKRHRSLFHQELHPLQTSSYQPHAARAVRDYLYLFLDDSANFLGHARSYVGASATEIAYGMKVAKTNDPYLKNAEEVSDGLMQAIYPGRFLVETIPLMRYIPSWFPGAKFQRLAKQWGKDAHKMIDVPWDILKQDREGGANKLLPSFASRCLDNIADSKNFEEDELAVKQTAGNVYLGAVDTSVAAISNFFLAMTLYPEAQRRAQEELDRVLKPGHLPDFEDQPSLPYITAIVKETLRWMPVARLGAAHFLTADDV